MAASCPNCGTCTCTGSYFVTALDGNQCCSQCVNLYNQAYEVKTILPQQKVKTKQ